MVFAFYVALVIFFVPHLAYGTGILEGGRQEGFWGINYVMMFSSFLHQVILMLMQIRHFNPVNILWQILNILCFIPFIAMVDNSTPGSVLEGKVFDEIMN